MHFKYSQVPHVQDHAKLNLHFKNEEIDFLKIIYLFICLVFNMYVLE